MSSIDKSAHILGKKWSIKIIEGMANGKFEGFNTFLRKEGLTAHILAGELKELEDEGLVEKRIEGGITEYILTKKGAELYNIVVELKKWNDKWNSKS
ncbi:MAG TPA: helix-turn-helix domain-containing protein [archaeon]|nr:helix-turn-helix domain-containing protein [archaeon]